VKDKSLDLGFDAKVMPSVCMLDWPPTRISQYALIDSIAFPASIHDLSWGSIFERPFAQQTLAPDLNPHDAKLLPRPFASDSLASFDQFINNQFWKNYDDLLSWTAKYNKLPYQDFLPVAFRDIDGTLSWSPGFKMTTPANARSIGFDVCDSGFLSILTNAGYSSHERSFLQDKFTDVINQYHLMAAESDAREFILARSQFPGLESHAPFSIVEVIAIGW